MLGRAAIRSCSFARFSFVKFDRCEVMEFLWNTTGCLSETNELASWILIHFRFFHS